ncbi:hypothetical protein C4J81_12385 [Deltaproteobacteria bacterium Smac51]|nr:hypothetical protein C4J81_12385 [Deltaproteobacteria bacterium Smac51]
MSMTVRPASPPSIGVLMDNSDRFKRAWLRQLSKAHHNILWRNNIQASPVSFSLMKGQKVWGRWSPENRLILISEELIQNHPWTAVLGILGHETAHQLVTDLARQQDEKPHGQGFHRMAARIGLDPFYCGASVELMEDCPRPWPDDDLPPALDKSARALEKVRKLLALGGSPVAAEAENAMNAAARLMARHNLDLLEAESRENLAGQYEYRTISLETRRINSRLALIAHILNRHFFVETIFVPGYNPLTDTEEKNLELMGRPENTRLAEHVFQFLMERTETLWRAHHRGHKGGGQVARNSFIIGLLEAFCKKLDEAAAASCETTEKSAPETDNDERPGFSAPVLARDIGLDDYIHRRHPKVTRTSSRRRFYDPESDKAGRAAGRALNLNRPVESRDTGSGPRRLINHLDKTP